MPHEIIALSSDDEYEDKAEKTVKTSVENKKPENSKTNNSSGTATLIIPDSEESDSLQSQSSSQHSENYEAEDENETEMKTKQHLHSASAQTEQQLQQVQRFLKSFDNNNTEIEKTANSLNELRNFRQAPKHHHLAGGLTKPGKFNISTKFLRKPRNKIKTQNLQQHTNNTTAIKHGNIEFQNSNSNSTNNNTSSSSSSNSSNINLINNNNIINTNIIEESIAKLKDFSIDSLLNH